jgi:N-acetyl-gamma-glutamyl-phosphate reductase
VRDRLSARTDLRVVSLPDALRKDLEARRAALNSADVVILCLPDDAAIAAVALLDPSNTRTVVIDASTAYRTAEGARAQSLRACALRVPLQAYAHTASRPPSGWVYGFPELQAGQKALIQASKRISNPGCYPTGFIALTRPLVDAGLLQPGTPLTVSAVSGYSGGGKALIKVYEDGAEPWGAYGFNMKHKHLPEMSRWSGLNTQPVFCPSVGSFAQGMVVSVPLHYSQLSRALKAGKQLHEALSRHYEGQPFVRVMAPNGSAYLERGAFLRPDSLNGTNALELFAFFDDEQQQALLCARLDNLGKGASGAAVQNLNLALGFEETAGLVN